MLDAEVNQMRVALEQLMERRNAAKVLVSQNRALLSKAHILPNEILSQIFLAMPFARTSSAIPPHEPAHFDLWRVTWVCRRWRSVAIDLGELWSNLEIVYRDGYPASHADDMARTYLERARHLPLSIELSTEGRSSGDWAIEAGLHSTDTIQRLKLYGIAKFFWRGAFLERSFPALTSLEVDTGAQDYWNSNDEKVDAEYRDEWPQRRLVFDLNQALEPLQDCPALTSLSM